MDLFFTSDPLTITVIKWQETTKIKFWAWHSLYFRHMFHQDYLYEATTVHAAQPRGLLRRQFDNESLPTLEVMPTKCGHCCQLCSWRPLQETSTTQIWLAECPKNWRKATPLTLLPAKFLKTKTVSFWNTDDGSLKSVIPTILKIWMELTVYLWSLPGLIRSQGFKAQLKNLIVVWLLRVGLMF